MAVKWGKKDVIAAFEQAMSQTTPGQPTPNIAEQIKQASQNKVIKPQ